MGSDGLDQAPGIDSTPVMYCEYAFGSPPTRSVTFHSMSAAQHSFTYERISGTWYCRLDGVARRTSPNPPFSSGDWVNAQGETSATHSQIGRMAPAKLEFTSAWYRTNNVWVNMSFTLDAVQAPYGRDTLGPGSLRNWTNAH